MCGRAQPANTARSEIDPKLIGSRHLWQAAHLALLHPLQLLAQLRHSSASL